MKFPSGPVVSIENGGKLLVTRSCTGNDDVSGGNGMLHAYLEYELSPRPKVVKWTERRQVGGNRLRRRLFQNLRAFWGISP